MVILWILHLYLYDTFVNTAVSELKIWQTISFKVNTWEIAKKQKIISLFWNE